jgi:peptide/nickel transport system permease protein
MTATSPENELETILPDGSALEPVAPPISTFKTLRRVLFDRPATIGAMIVVLLFVLVAVLAPVLAPYDPLQQSILSVNQRPSAEHLVGTDQFGRDVLSRLIYGARISMTIGLVGVAISFVLGIVIGGLAGYLGGWFDLVVQRMIEVLQSLPTLPLWLALAALMPVSWSPVVVYFGITIILGLIDWTGLARAVRSKLLALREEDYVLAARLLGAGPARIIGRHLIPGFMSHLIASATITIPGMILGETALSFLGLGMRAPAVSWGVLLNEAQNINVVVLYPWLMMPVVPVMVVILAFSFLGDGLRDAADPHH